MKRYKKHVNGFITIEYTLLIPLLLMLYTFLVCMGLYQYNQCVLRTNIYLLGVESLELADEDATAKITALKKIEKQLYYDKYILTENLQTVYSARGNHIAISGSGTMFNSLAEWGIGEENWYLEASCAVNTVNAAEIMRLCKTVYNIAQETLSKEGQEDGS